MGWSLENLDTAAREQIAANCFTVKKIGGDEMHGLCPAHDDTNASFSYNIAKDACKCLTCGFSGDLITLWGHANGISDNSEAFKGFRSAHGLAVSSSGKVSAAQRSGVRGGEGGNDAPVKTEPTKIIDESEYIALLPMSEAWRRRCRNEFGWSDAVMDSIGIRIKGGDTPRLAIPIRQDDGALVNIRLYLPGADDNKIISWGKGYGKAKLFPCPSSLKDDPIILCEGEKDTITAISHGLNAVTQTAGVSSWDHARFNRFFTGRRVVIAYDNDDPGKIGSAKVAKLLSEVAATVHIIKWPSCMEYKQDVCDWFTVHGKTVEEFKDLFAGAEQIKTATPSVTKSYQVDVIDFFIGKQFKPRLCANHIMREKLLSNDPRTGQIYQWDGRQFKETHASTIRKNILGVLDHEGTTSRANDVLHIIEDLTIISDDRAYNDQPDQLPLKNGMFSLRSGTLANHNPENLNNYCLDITLRMDHDSMPKCPHFTKFMMDFIPDDSSRKEILKYAAYCLTRETKRERALFLVGPGGDGKSLFINILSSILGETNVSSVSMGDLDDQFQRVQIKDKLLNVSTEVEGGLLQSNMFKALVSGDWISASFKHKDSFRFKPVAKHIFAANKFPTMQDTTRGLLRKIIVVEVNRNFATMDLDLFDKIQAESDGVFLMLIRHLQLLQEEGFKDHECKYLIECRARFAESNNPVLGFIDFCIDTKVSALTSEEVMGVYKRYSAYCLSRGYKPKNESNFGRELKAAIPSIEKKRDSSGARQHRYYGISMPQDT